MHQGRRLRDGILADVAPTLCELLGIPPGMIPLDVRSLRDYLATVPGIVVLRPLVSSTTMVIGSFIDPPSDTTTPRVMTGCASSTVS